MRDRKLTGRWAGFSFVRGVLVTPEGREFGPDDLSWLGLTVGIAREWKLMMSEDRAGKPARIDGKVVQLRDALRVRQAERKRA